jgi:hypothetical protein
VWLERLAVANLADGTLGKAGQAAMPYRWTMSLGLGCDGRLLAVAAGRRVPSRHHRRPPARRSAGGLMQRRAVTKNPMQTISFKESDVELALVPTFPCE